MKDLSVNEAKKNCLQNPECSFILNDTMIHFCSGTAAEIVLYVEHLCIILDTSVSISKRDKGSRLLIKGSKGCILNSASFFHQCSQCYKI
jgi:hypothetical protein